MTDETDYPIDTAARSRTTDMKLFEVLKNKKAIQKEKHSPPTGSEEASDSKRKPPVYKGERDPALA
jgi:hypothetical protein